MAVRNIPARRVFVCDGCSAEVESNSRPPHWTGLVIEANAYDYQGCAVADAGFSRILCADCTKVVHSAINAAMQERRDAIAGTHAKSLNERTNND